MNGIWKHNANHLNRFIYHAREGYTNDYEELFTRFFILNLSKCCVNRGDACQVEA